VKKLAAFFCVLLVGTSVYATDFKVSAGPTIGLDFNHLEGSNPIPGASDNGYPDSKYTFNLNKNYFATGAFLDATYAVLSVSYLYELGNSCYDTTISGLGASNSVTAGSYYERSQLFDISLLAKYPFKLSEAVSVFPSAGIGYSIYVRSDNQLSGDQRIDDSDFFILLGGGVDIALTKKLYIRTAFNYGFNVTPKPVERPAIDLSWQGRKINAGIALGIVL